MDFDSHLSSMALAAVDLTNLLTPGLRRARDYVPPVDDERAEAIVGILSEHAGHRSRRPADAETAELTGWAGRLRSVIETVDAGHQDAACEALNAVLREAGAVPTLARHHGEDWHLHFHPDDASYVASWTAGMATGLAMVLGRPPVTRLGLCTAPACDRAYADTSRNNSRRFCSTACQNRVKAATYRARRA